METTKIHPPMNVYYGNVNNRNIKSLFLRAEFFMHMQNDPALFSVQCYLFLH